MEQFSSHSCVKWRPHLPTDMDYVHILRDSGCYSRVGRTGRAQVLSLGKLFVFYPKNQPRNKENTCLKITQNVGFEFSNFGIAINFCSIKSDMSQSGNTY